MDEQLCRVVVRLCPSALPPCIHPQKAPKSTLLTVSEGKAPLKVQTFEFENVALGGTGEVYSQGVRSVVGKWLKGENGACLAYGAGGSGKTFTLFGGLEGGLVGCAIREAMGRTELGMSYVEIRNERMLDLLDSENARLSIAEDPLRGTYVQGLTHEPIRSLEAANDLIRLGNARRKQEKCKAHGLPSHSILTLSLQSACFQFVDLAYGEAGSVSKSLLALSACLVVLAKGKPAFTPYRESKLTRLLKDTAAVVLVACVCPAMAEESLQTLKFAYRLERCRTQSSPTPVVDSLHKDTVQEPGGSRKVLCELRDLAVDKGKRCRRDSEDWLYYQKLGEALSGQLALTEDSGESEERENDHSAALQDAQIRHLIQLSEQRNGEKDRAIGALTQELAVLKGRIEQVKYSNQRSQRSAGASPSRGIVPRLQLSSLMQARKAHKEAKQSGETLSCFNSARSLESSSGPQSYR